MPKVSVIVPVYNVEKYLQKCLDSLVSQTFKDIEIICVNDGSPDNSIEILNSYAQKDERVRVINKENGGLFSARHEGMKYINGEYTVFVDSDDWVSTELIEKCLDAVKNETADIVIYGAYSVREINGKITCKRGGYDFSKIPAKYRNKVFNKNDFKKDIFKFPPTAWSKMYRTDFLINNDIRFQEIKNGEDQLFFIHSMLFADKIKVVNENLYYYIKSRAGAITAVNKKTSLSPIYNLYEIDKLFNKVVLSEDFKRFILSKYFKKALSWYAKASDDISEEFYLEVINLQKYLIENYPECWWKRIKISPKDSYIKIKLKVIAAQLLER